MTHLAHHPGGCSDDKRSGSRRTACRNRRCCLGRSRRSYRRWTKRASHARHSGARKAHRSGEVVDRSHGDGCSPGLSIEYGETRGGRTGSEVRRVSQSHSKVIYVHGAQAACQIKSGRGAITDESRRRADQRCQLTARRSRFAVRVDISAGDVMERVRSRSGKLVERRVNVSLTRAAGGTGSSASRYPRTPEQTPTFRR